ncbi:MAG TPA: hypothetical protein VFP29_05465, partial [Methyloceanibacter sp.]|nr:hypothetical protein [Methyloceanibacter sp.]
IPARATCRSSSRFGRTSSTMRARQDAGLFWASFAARFGPRRASSGHWSYDLNRHLALVTAYKAEASRLEVEEARLRPTAPVAVET